MNLKEYLTEDRVVVLKGSTKAQTLAELSEKMSQVASVDAAELNAAVEAREELMSTGIGRGLAVPHVRLASVRQLSIVVGVSSEGITDYKSLDDEPVRIVVLIAAPAGQHEAYIKLLALVVDALKQEQVRSNIQNAATPEEILSLLTG